MQAKFSQQIHEELERLEDQLFGMARRQEHIATFNVALDEVTKGKPFRFDGAIWVMLLGERDMIVTDLASWAQALYTPKGSFLMKIQGNDLTALDWHVDDKRDPYLLERSTAWRKEAFARLFPNATGSVPKHPDVQRLCERLTTQLKPLVQDRHDHRAHKYGTDSKATAKMLALHEVTAYFDNCKGVLKDLRCLGLNSSRSGGEIQVGRDDRQAQGLVDLLLFGSIDYLLHEIEAAEIDEPWHHARREEFYRRLHAEHDARGAPHDLTFNRIPGDALRGRR